MFRRLAFFSLLFLFLMLCPAWEALGVAVNPSGWLASDLENICKSSYTVHKRRGILGTKLHGRLQKNHLYQRFDSLLGGVVYVTTDSNRSLDPRPLGSGSVLECSFGGVMPLESESKMCELSGGKFKPLKRGNPRAKSRVQHRFIYSGDWSDRNPSRGFKWELTREVRMQRRDKKVLVSTVALKGRKPAGKVIVPGKTIPKFYRKDDQYWKYVEGMLYAVKKGHWMQMFKDQKYYQVRTGYHLEAWPGEPHVMVQVGDDEAWVKVGRGRRAFVWMEKTKRRDRINWAKYYLPGTPHPANPNISAAAACRTCTGETTVPVARMVKSKKPKPEQVETLEVQELEEIGVQKKKESVKKEKKKK